MSTYRQLKKLSYFVRERAKDRNTAALTKQRLRGEVSVKGQRRDLSVVLCDTGPYLQVVHRYRICSLGLCKIYEFLSSYAGMDR